MKFKEGDIVKYVSGSYHDCESNPLWGGKFGYIKGIIDVPNGIRVLWDNGKHNGYIEKDLEFVKITTNTKKLNQEYIKYDKTKNL